MTWLLGIFQNVYKVYLTMCKMIYNIQKYIICITFGSKAQSVLYIDVFLDIFGYIFKVSFNMKKMQFIM